MSYQPNVKDILPSINLVVELMQPDKYTVNLNTHYLHQGIFNISKADRQFAFSSSSKVQKGLQTHKEIQFSRNDIVELKGSKHTFFVEGKYLLLNNISYDDDYNKLFSGTINSFSSSVAHTVINNRFLRMVIPEQDKDVFNLHEFKHLYFVTPKKSHIDYLPVLFENSEYHIYKCTSNKKKYIIIDCVKLETLIEFQKKCFNILLAYGFITGRLIHDECFILSFSNEAMATPEGFLYHAMRASVITNQPTFTSNPFSVNSDIDFEREEHGKIKEAVTKKLYEGIDDFPRNVFSKLVELFYKEEKLQRAALLFIQSHITSLEMRIPNYYVAIEAITGYISSSITIRKKSLAPIKDTTIASDFIKYIKEEALKLKAEKGLDDDLFNMDIIEKNIAKLNAPPNADKLAESFTLLGYNLSGEERKILKDRNTFLHGSFLKTIDDDLAFREALHVGLRVHFLIAVALLKLAGFSGKIINYAELWSHITEKELNEERLTMI
ncbi:MAG: hypothetical protein K2X48_18365 [Chitinophagaceae bacterium]|nr:hypothetical protein [Chitinophagaceae bacterium]